MVKLSDIFREQAEQDKVLPELKEINKTWECGMLPPTASLPSWYDIGAFSKEGYEFVNISKTAGQKYWQVPPLGPTGFGDSLYQSFSAFAGNPYFTDLEKLTAEGLLIEEECREVDFGGNERDIGYKELYDGRFPLLRKVYERWKSGLEWGSAVHDLVARTLGEEIRRYCLYMAIKNHFGSKSWNLWGEDIRLRKREAATRYREQLSDETGSYEFQQIKFEEQWTSLKQHVNEQDMRIIGDIPTYVTFDGVDNRSHPELFQSDEKGTPVAVAGCLSDEFPTTGQPWGNPLYNWGYHGYMKYNWRMRCMKYSFHLYGVVRVDHSRGFDEHYLIPYGDKTVEHGHWEKGPGIKIFRKMQTCFGEGDLPIIAEDLGFLTPIVLQLVRDSGSPEMKVLELASDQIEDSAYLLHKYGENCVVYTGTHDNDTLVSWFAGMNDHDRAFAREYIGNERIPEDQVHWDFIRLAMLSVARLAVIPVQDYPGLETEARTNEPSILGKNWRRRMHSGDLEDGLIRKCRCMADIYGRL